MSTEVNSLTKSGRIRMLGLLHVLLTIACVLPIWACHYFPSQNGPSLLLTSFMQRELENPDYGYSSFYDWHAFPIPYLLQSTGLNLLFYFADPLAADKIWISVVVLLRCLSVFYFLRCVQRGREVYALAGLLFVYDFSLMRGYFNYHAGISIGLLVFGYYLTHRVSWTKSSLLVFNMLVLLHYFTHPVALAVTGLFLATYEFAMTRSPVRILGIVLRGYVPSLCLLTGFLYWSQRYGAWVTPDVEFLTISDKIQNSFYRGGTPLSAAANLASLFLLVGIGGFGMVSLLSSYGQWAFDKIYVNPTLIVKEPMIAVLLAAVGLYLLMPWSMIGWHKADVRILPFVFLLILAVPRPIRSSRWQTGFVGIVGLLVVATLFPITRQLRRGSAEVAEYVAGIESVPPASRILPLFAPEEKADDWKLSYAIDPLRRADAYYALARGGASGNTLAVNNTLHLVWYKDYRDQADFPKVDRKDPSSEQIQRAAEAYSTILLWKDREPFQELFMAHGFETTFEQGRLTILTRTPDVSQKVSAR